MRLQDDIRAIYPWETRTDGMGLYINRPKGETSKAPLVITKREPTAPRNGCISKSYCDTLDEGLVHHYRRRYRFMQDKAAIHTSRMVVDYPARKGITPITWPAHLPDLNPIEHLWWRLRKILYKDFSQFNNFKRAQEHWADFWLRIPESLINRLILSRPQRKNACRRIIKLSLLLLKM